MTQTTQTTKENTDKIDVIKILSIQPLVTEQESSLKNGKEHWQVRQSVIQLKTPYYSQYNRKLESQLKNIQRTEMNTALKMSITHKNDV